MTPTAMTYTSGIRGPISHTGWIRACAFVAAILGAGRLEAATYYVSTAGNDSNSCATAQSDTQTSHKLTVSAGISCASAGDTVFIHGGTYTSAKDTIDSQNYPLRSGTSFTNAVTISGFPGETVILQPPNNVSGVRLTTGSPSYLIIQDLTIDMVNTGASAEGVFLYTAHHIRMQRLEVMHGYGFGFHFGDLTPHNEVLNCRIHDIGQPNSAPIDGHGLYITGSDNLFADNDVYDNQGYGFHIYNNHGPHDDPSRNIIRNNRIHGNGVHGAPAYGIVISYGDANVIENNLIYDNMQGIQVYSASTGTLVYNNTVYRNKFEGIALQYYASAPTVRNNIVYANGAGDIVDYGGSGTPTVDHNLTTNPSFTNAADWDLTLQAGSAARNAGMAIAAVLTDYAYDQRPQNGPYTIGAFEVEGTKSLDAPANLRVQ